MIDEDISIAPLKDLYQLLGDGTKGYSEAASRVKTPQLAAFLSNLASDRSGMQRELGKAIYGMHPNYEELDEGTLKGDLHRAWIKVRESLSSSKDPAVLDECDRGEEYLMTRFKTVIEDKGTPGEVLLILRDQLSKIMELRATIQDLRTTMQYASE